MFGFNDLICRVLTWEDGYYDKCDSSSSEPLENSPAGSLGLALAKMSYHVYPLGEGYVSFFLLTFSLKMDA